jgi:ubiquinone biosynthesis protein
VRETLENLGPTFVKVGQFLSMRPDLIPAEYCEEFLHLTDEVRTVPFKELRPVVEEDLGDIRLRFAFFDPQPLAAGSLAQVHVAHTHAGDEVAVKILRPGVEAAIRSDLRKANAVARVLGLLGVASVVSPVQVAAELERWLNEELDFPAELRHVIRMRDLVGESDIMVVAKPYPELSSRRVLTCELLRGTPFSEILRTIRAGKADLVIDKGHDPDRLGENLLEAVLTQIFRYEFFHADVHPGNLLALPDDRIGVLDLALIDSLDPVVRKGTARYLTAVVDQDPAGMQRAVTDVLRTTEDSDLETFQSDFTAATRNLLRERARMTDGEGQRQIVRGYMINVMQIARSKGLVVPPSMLSLYRSLLAAEAIASQLSASADLLSVGGRFFRRQQFESSLEMSDPKQIQRMGLQVISLMQNGPGQLARLLEDLADERFVLHVRSADAGERRRQHNARVQLVTLGLVAVSVSVLLAGVLIGAPAALLFGRLPVRAVMIAALVAVYAALIVQWRRLR